MNNSQLPDGYKLTEVGVIPEDWDIKPTKGMISISHGFAFEGRYFANSGSSYRLTTPGHFYEQGGFREVGEKQKFYLGEIPSEYILQPGDLIVAMTEQADGLLGSTAFIPGEGYLHNQRIGRIRTLSPAIDLNYLFFVCNSLGYRAKVCETAAGTKVKHTSPEKLMEISIPIPALPEQRSIATALSDMDELLGGLDRLIVKKRDLKQSAMQQLLTGKIRLPGFDGKWDVKTFGDVAFPRRDRVDPRRTRLQEFCVELEHIASGSGVLVGSTTTSEQSSIKSVFSPGDVLFGKLRSYLRKYWRSNCFGVCSTEIWVLAPKNDLIVTEFLFQIVKTDNFVEEAGNSYGTHMPRSDWKVVSLYQLVLPPLPEQTAIASILSDMDTEIAAIEQRRNKTRDLKQAMMQELLTGRIRLKIEA